MIRIQALDFRLVVSPIRPPSGRDVGEQARQWLEGRQ